MVLKVRNDVFNIEGRQQWQLSYFSCKMTILHSVLIFISFQCFIHNPLTCTSWRFEQSWVLLTLSVVASEIFEADWTLALRGWVSVAVSVALRLGWTSRLRLTMRFGLTSSLKCSVIPADTTACFLCTTDLAFCRNYCFPESLKIHLWPWNKRKFR